MNPNAKIFVAGHNGLVGSAITRKLQQKQYTHIITRTRKELDLLDAIAVKKFFAEEMPDYVFLAAAKVGGIEANRSMPADFIYQNLQIQNHIIHYSQLSQVKKILFLGSSCIYPKLCPQPIKEEYLLTGPLEETNAAYAMAKIAGIKMCEAYAQQYGLHYIALMPPNLYGIFDNFNLTTSHVMAALIRKFHEAKTNRQPYVSIWGTGTPQREFLDVDDFADACVFIMNHNTAAGLINVGVGKDITILDLALLIKKITGYQGDIQFDHSKPDGTPRKVLDVSKMNALGWQAQTSLEDGINKAYHWYVANNREPQ